MNRTLLGMLIAACIVAAPCAAGAGSFESYQSPSEGFQFDLSTLDHPRVGALSVRGGHRFVVGKARYDWLGVAVGGDGLVSNRYHPDDHARFGLGIDGEWSLLAHPWWGAPKAAHVEGGPDVDVPYRYFGTLSVSSSGELLPAPAGSHAWKFTDVDAAATLTQQVPGTDVDWFYAFRPKAWRNANAYGRTPLTLAFVGRRLFRKVAPDTTYDRAEGYADWSTLLLPLPIADSRIYLHPHGQFVAQTHEVPALYGSASIAVYNPRLKKALAGLFEKLGVTPSPYLFARYRSGRRGPSFDHVDGWEYGFEMSTDAFEK